MPPKENREGSIQSAHKKKEQKKTIRRKKQQQNVRSRSKIKLCAYRAHNACTNIHDILHSAWAQPKCKMTPQQNQALLHCSRARNTMHFSFIVMQLKNSIQTVNSCKCTQSRAVLLYKVTVVMQPTAAAAVEKKRPHFSSPRHSSFKKFG